MGAVAFTPPPGGLPAAPAGVRSRRGPGWLLVHDDGAGWLGDGVADLVLTDPPFNVARDTNFHTWERNRVHSYRFDGQKGWDSHSHEGFVALLGVWAGEFARLLRRGGTAAVFCADDYVSHVREALDAAGLKRGRTITWRKPNAVPVNRAHVPMSATEYVVTAVKPGKARGRGRTFNATVDLDDAAVADDLAVIEAVLAGDKAAALVEQRVRAAVAAAEGEATDRRSEVVAALTAEAVAGVGGSVREKVAAMYVEGSLRGCVPNHVAFPSASGRRLHPTEKPVALLRYLSALFSRPGDLVVDPFAGSASTGEAALRGCRRVVLVERDGELVGPAGDRLAALAGEDSEGGEVGEGSEGGEVGEADGPQGPPPL